MIKNQAQRLLSKDRKKGVRYNGNANGGSNDGSVENGGWISKHANDNAASLNLFRVSDRSRTTKIGKKGSDASRKSQFSTLDDTSSSNSDSDESHNIISKSKGNKQSKKHESKIIKTKKVKNKKSTMARSTFTKVSHRVSSAGKRSSTSPENSASDRAIKAVIPEGLTSPSQLQWYKINLGKDHTGSREKLQPCRKLSRAEIFKYKQKHGDEGIDTSQGTSMIEYLTLSNDSSRKHFLCVDDSSLIPFGYRAKDGISFTFNDDYLQRYLKEQRKTCSKSALREQRSYLDRVCKHAIQTEKELRDDANQDLEDYYEDCSVKKSDARVHFEIDEESNNESDESDADMSDDEDLDIPYTQAITFDPDKFDPESEKSNEPIRIGDVIQYYSPIHVAGDPRGLREATVLSIDPKKEFPLVLDNAECIPDNTNVKRIKVKMNGVLVEHPGIFRPITKFKLTKAGTATAADALRMQSSRFNGIMRKNMKKLQTKAEKSGFAPMDLIVKMKGVNDSSQSSSEVSAPKPKARKIQRTLPSSSSESSDEDSSDGDSSDEDSSNNKASSFARSKSLSSNTPKVASLRSERAFTPRLKENEGNASSASQRDRQLSLGSISSKGSLGSSLASSDDDSSVESRSINLGKNQKSMTQQYRKGKDDSVALTKKSGILDLSLSSDDSVDLSPIKSKTKSSRRLLPSGNTSDSSVDSTYKSIVMKPRRGMSTATNKSTSPSSSDSPKAIKKNLDAKKRLPYSYPASTPSFGKTSSGSPSKRKRTTPPSKQHRETDSEATNELGWTQTSGGWVKSNEGAGAGFSFSRFK